MKSYQPSAVWGSALMSITAIAGDSEDGRLHGLGPCYEWPEIRVRRMLPESRSRETDLKIGSSYSAFASSNRCFSNWAVHVATGPRTVPSVSPVS